MSKTNSGYGQTVGFWEAFRVWVKVALLSFGGPTGQIAVMHRILVDERRWISEQRFLHALNYCMLLPGPEAQQLAVYIGWLLHGWRGGLTAGTLFVLPGFLSILALSIAYATWSHLGVVQAVFVGLKAGVLAIVIEALIHVSRRIWVNKLMPLLSVAAFVAIFFFQIPFPVIILSAGLLGFMGGTFFKKTFCIVKGKTANNDSAGEKNYVISDAEVETSKAPSLRRSVRVLAVWVTLWALPIATCFYFLGAEHTLTKIGIFFSKAAVVTFGGAYSILTYVAQQAVQNFHWLSAEAMLDGLGMAETTPGPLIQVVQFVGYMGAWHNPAPFTPLVAGVIGSMLTAWVTFTPCFLWIFLGAPYIEYLRNNKHLTAALSAITAAVVGVILNLAVWFALHTLFESVEEHYAGYVRFFTADFRTIKPAELLVSLFSFVALFRLRLGMVRVLGLSVLLGVLLYYSI